MRFWWICGHQEVKTPRHVSLDTPNGYKPNLTIVADGARVNRTRIDSQFLSFDVTSIRRPNVDAKG